MIDILDILFTTGMVLYVIWRAILLDRLVPWFTREPLDPAVLDSALRKRRTWSGVSPDA
jgi:hypothetical protein